MALWKPLDGILPPVAISNFKGIDRQDMFGIGDGAATYVKNLCASLYPAMTVRPGYTQLGASFGDMILGLAAWKDTELHAVGGGSWKKWTGSAWTSLLSGLGSGSWTWCNFQGNFSQPYLLGSNGTGYKYSGSTVGTLLNFPSNCPYIDSHDDRVYAAGGNNLNVSGLRQAENWTVGTGSADPAQKIIETADGKGITGIKAGPQHLIVFKNRYMFELWGTSVLDYELQMISSQIGCVTQNASVMGPDGNCYFVSVSGIYKYGGGVLPDKSFSLPAQWYIDSMNPSAAANCVAGTDGTSVYFGISWGRL